jgi:hypothetical protein
MDGPEYHILINNGWAEIMYFLGGLKITNPHKYWIGPEFYILINNGWVFSRSAQNKTSSSIIDDPRISYSHK